jgi:hypothetical protein
MIGIICRISMYVIRAIRRPLLLKMAGCLLAGSFPSKQLKMVQAWIEIHKDELFADLEMAVAGEEPFRIAPLQ